MINKPNNIVRIPTSLYGKFFRYWFEFLKPFHNLTNKEMDVVTCMLKHRFELSKVIKDNNILDKVLMSDDTRKKIKAECGVTPQYFQVIMGKLRKCKIIVNNKIDPKFIPNISENDSSFQLLLLFDLNDTQRNNKKSSQ